MSPVIAPLIVAAGFLAMGLVALWQPVAVTRLLNLYTLNADLRNEVRAVYGGFGLAMTLMLVIAAYSETLAGGIMLTVAAALGGMAAGRVVAWLLERSGRWPVVFGMVEAAAAVALALTTTV